MKDNKRYWLRGGIIYIILYLISYLGTGVPGIGFIMLIPLLILGIPLVPVELLALYIPIPLIINLLAVVALFFPGMIIGYLYGKIKNRNKI